MPWAIWASSPPPVKTNWPFLALTIAVPVSWHIGSTPPAATAAFLSRSVATKRSFGARLGVVEDVAELLEVGRAEEVGDVAHRLGGQLPDRLRLDLQERPLGCVEGRDALGRDQPVRGVVVAQRQQLGEGEIVVNISHGSTLRATTVRHPGDVPIRPTGRASSTTADAAQTSEHERPDPVRPAVGRSRSGPTHRPARMPGTSITPSCNSRRPITPAMTRLGM